MPRFTDEDVAIRKAHWARRLPQMLEVVGVWPYWQFRVVGDKFDPPDCVQWDGRIERWDSPFWAEHKPAHCKRRDCRCTIRTYRQRDIDRLGL